MKAQSVPVFSLKSTELKNEAGVVCSLEFGPQFFLHPPGFGTNALAFEMLNARRVHM